MVPLSLDFANAIVADLHRHHEPVRGHRFSIGALLDRHTIVGACIVGRPVAPKTDYRTICEVTRLVTDGTDNACSFLYGAAARICREMGYARIQTFVLDSEPGTTLRAAGWVFEGMSYGGEGWQNRPGRKHTQPTVPKQRWARRLIK